MTTEENKQDENDDQNNDNNNDKDSTGDIEFWRSKATGLETQFAELQTRFASLEGDYKKTKTDLKTTREKHKSSSPEAKHEYEESVRQEYESQYSGKIADLQSSLVNKEALIRRLTITNQAKTYAAKYFQADIADLIVREVEAQSDLDGEEVVVKDKSGTVRQSQSKRGQRMTLEELFQELAEKFPSARNPNIKSGTAHQVEKASGKGSGSSSLSTPPGFGGWSQKDQTQWFAENPDARRAFLKERHGRE